MIRAGEVSAALVGGFESMTHAPRTVPRTMTSDPPTSLDLLVNDGLWCSIDDVGMGPLSDAENKRLGITRLSLDEYAFLSHQRAGAATDSNKLAAEMIDFDGLARSDQGIRRDTDLDKLANLPAAFSEGGTTTAGNSSQMSDAAAVGIVAAESVARAWGATPLSRIRERAVIAGPDSALHLRPAEAAALLLSRAGLTPADIGVWEINEAFAGVTIASTGALGVDPAQLNVNGGAIALGHPLGASGFRLVMTLAYEMRRRGAEFGVAAICGGGGQGQAILLQGMS
jgi:acetyl-CoA C-acetyltransferase